MGLQIIAHPKGGYNVFSTVVDSWMFVRPITRKQVVHYFRARAAERAVADTRRLLDELDGGGKPYLQFTMTYKEAEDLRRDVHGKEKSP